MHCALHSLTALRTTLTHTALRTTLTHTHPKQALPLTGTTPNRHCAAAGQPVSGARAERADSDVSPTPLTLRLSNPKSPRGVATRRRPPRAGAATPNNAARPTAPPAEAQRICGRRGRAPALPPGIRHDTVNQNARPGPWYRRQYAAADRAAARVPGGPPARAGACPAGCTPAPRGAARSRPPRPPTRCPPARPDRARVTSRRHVPVPPRVSGAACSVAASACRQPSPLYPSRRL